MVISSSPSGMAGLMLRGRMGADWICFMATDMAFSASKGRRPVSISNSITPTE